MSWFSRAYHGTVGYITHKGNIPGDPQHRGKGPPEAPIVEAPISADTNPQGQLILMGGAALALILLLKDKKNAR